MLGHRNTRGSKARETETKVRRKPKFGGRLTLHLFVAAVVVGNIAAAAFYHLPVQAATTTVTFAASDDAWVDYASGQTTVNHGSDTALYNDNTSGVVRKTFLKFNVTSLPAGAVVNSAEVDLTATAVSGSSTINFKPVSDTSWIESTITAANAPAYGSALVNSVVSAAGVVAFPIAGSNVPSNGTYSFATTTADALRTTWASKEAASGAPVLKVTYSTPVPDATSPATFNAVEDAYVSQASPTTNYGSDAHLYNVNTTSAVKRTFLKFNVQGIPAGDIVTGFTVNVYANNGSTSTINLKQGTSNSWTEGSVNWSTQPGYNSTSLYNAQVSAGSKYISFPVSGNSVVSGNGTYTFALTTSDAVNTTDWASKDAAANPPTLTVTFKAPSPLTVNPTDDSYVDQANPTSNFGSATTMTNNNTSGSVKRSWLKFKVPALPLHARVTNAVLKVNATNTPSGVTANVKQSTDTSWTESSLTWNNAPAYNATALANGSPNPVVAGTESFDVTSAVTGSGQFSFVLTQTQATSTNWATKESATPPQLVVTWTTEPNYGHDMIITAAGDIACDPDTAYSAYYNGGLGTATACAEGRTSDAVMTSSPSGGLPDRVLTLGDNQYMCGGLSAYQQSYGPTWGRFLSITSPLSGNHERNASGGTDCDATSKAIGFRTYFQSAYTPPPTDTNVGTYWSEDLPNNWHVIALDSDCSRSPNPCAVGGPQDLWEQQDLAAAVAAGRNIFAIWHHPVWSDGDHGDYSLAQNNPGIKALWDNLFTYGGGKVLFVLNGHEHNTQEFSALNQNGTPASAGTGIREFIIGSGGKEHLSAALTSAAQASFVASDTTNFQVMRLILHANGAYDVHWVPIAGGTTNMPDGSFSPSSR